MYSYELIDINEKTQPIVQKLFDDYFPEKADTIPAFIESGRLHRFVVATINNEIVGAMGILNEIDTLNIEELSPDPNKYSFFHLVVSEQHRGAGVATGIIRSAIKLLLSIGATHITNHKRENIIPHTIFTEMGFTETHYDDSADNDYKWRYELPTANADMVKLNNIWSQYEIKQEQNT